MNDKSKFIVRMSYSGNFASQFIEQKCEIIQRDENYQVLVKVGYKLPEKYFQKLLYAGENHIVFGYYEEDKLLSVKSIHISRIELLINQKEDSPFHPFEEKKL